METITTEFEFKQTNGADETLVETVKAFEARNLGRRVVKISFIAASPAERDGRWVTLEVEHTLDRTYACAD